MRFLCALGLVGFLVGCGKVGEASDDRARTVDPVLKSTPVDSPPAVADAAKQPATTRVANAPPEPSTAAEPSKQAPATPPSPVDAIINKYVDSGVDGVVDVRTDKSGAITKVVVVGASPITTVLGAADGLLTARREARLRAAGKFRQFLKEKVSVEEKSETERVVKLESEKGSDLTESGKKLSKFSDKYQTVSEGMVKGLQVLGYKTVSLNAKEKVYVMVCGWDAVTSKAVGNLADELDKDMDKGGKGGESPEERRKLQDQQNVTPAGSKFFDKLPSDTPPTDKPPSDKPSSDSP
jgi:hypothetical protein